MIAMLLCLLCGLSAADEFHVYFDTSKPLGLKLSTELVVQGFHRQGNSKMPAESSGWIRIGDKLVELNEKPVAGKDLNTVAQMIGKADLPKKLTFSAAGGANRTAEMASVYNGPSGIHGHEGVLEIAKDGNPLGSVPFLQAMFGGQTSCRVAPLVFASPSHGCGAYRNPDAVFDSIVLVERGVCAFSDKAIIAQQASALGIVVMNDSPGDIVRMPIDPSEKADISLPAVMIDQGDAQTIRHLVEGSKIRKSIVGRLVRKGLKCKPWKGATVMGEANANAGAPGNAAGGAGSSVGDPAAKSGEVLLFMPDVDLHAGHGHAGADHYNDGSKSRKGNIRGASGKSDHGAADGDGDGDAPAHMHAAGYYSESADGRGSDGLLHGTGGGDAGGDDGAVDETTGLPIDQEDRAMTGGSRAKRMLNQHARNGKASSKEVDDDVVEAVDVSRDGDSASTVASDAEAAQSPEVKLAALRGKAHGTFEYLLAANGQPVPQGSLRLVQADPSDACGPLTNSPDELRGGAVLVDRGTCSFQVKSRHLSAAGASLMVVANNNAGLFAVTTAASLAVNEDDSSKSEEDKAAEALPAIMVTKIAGRAIRAAIADARDRMAAAASAASNAAGSDHAHMHQHVGTSPDAHGAQNGVTISLLGDARFAGIWEELTALMDTSSWPSDAVQRRKLYLRLSRLHHPDRSSGSADRFELLSYLYRRANFKHDPSSEPDFEDDYQAPMGGV